MIIVINPKSKPEHALRDWDLWGPLIMCLFLSVVLAITSSEGQTTIIFTGVFSIITFGAAAATANFMLLGGTVGFFPSVCAVGYCLVPLCVSSFVSAIVSFIMVKLIIVPLGLWWSVSSVSRFFAGQIPENRRIIGIYPFALLYAILSWMIFIH